MPDIKDFRLPDLGEGLEDGEIAEWHVAVGDVIELNQAVASVETAKAIVEIPSPFAGTVVERVGEVGETLEVGTVFLRIDVDVEGGAVAPDAVDEPEANGESSPAQGGFETGTADADAAVPDADAQPTAAVASERRPSSALDADDEPQPLVGYGQGRAGARRRRRRGGPAGAGSEEAADDAAAGSDGAAAAGSAVAAAPSEPRAKPPVRKLAKDLGVDLADLAPGSGPDGTITRDDVHAAADAATAPLAAGDDRASGAEAEAEPARAGARAGAVPPAAAGAPSAGGRSGSVQGFRGRRPGEVEQVRGIRKRIVEKMETSRRDIPEATCSRDADLTELWELRRTLTEQAHDEGYEVKITPFALVLRATVIALRRFPTLNARFDGDAGEIHLLEPINLGFAADTDRGLVVPNIKDAHTRSLVELAQELHGLASAARDGSIGPGALTGGTFTVNNYGAFGNDDGDAIINHPEAGILGVGAIRERPWVVDGELAVRRVARFTLAFDHRVCDGGEAGRFVTYVADLCEQPSRLLLHA